MSNSSVSGWCAYEAGSRQLPVHACGNTLSGEPDAGKSACPVRRGESGSHRKVSPSLLLYREIGLFVRKEFTDLKQN